MSSTNSMFKYTGLTYPDIIKAIQDKLAADPRFDNFREGQLAQTLNEIFAGTADLTNYYIQRQAEESFFETSQRDSSAILNSRNLAYDITRPIPATTTIKITISGDMRSKILQGRKLQIPVFSKFTYNNFDFILKKGFTYTFTRTDAEEVILQAESYTKTITTDDDGDPITLIQGTLKSKIIVGDSNPQIGQIFQTYRIPDTSFSNYYGNADLADYPTTRVWVGVDQSTANEYTIDRRSLMNDTVLQTMLAGDTIKCALIRTAIDGDVELKFGTTKIAYTGATVHTGSPETTYDNIYIQYLSTLGSKANQTGIIDAIVTQANQIIVNTYNITSNVEFAFVSNIIGGSDIENQESIKVNAPSIFYSLDRAVTNQDHVNILKSLTSPIAIKNAMSWGEQEEADARNVAAIVELFNVGFFTCVGTLYNIEGDSTTDTFSVRTNENRIDESVLDDNFDEDGLSSQYYFNIYVKDLIARQLKEQEVNTWYWHTNNYTAVGTSIDTAYFITNYAEDTNIYYAYNSDKYLTSVSADASEYNYITINCSAISNMDSIASLIQTQFRTKLDTRSLITNGIQGNANYGQLAFPEIAVTWNSETRKFTITNDVDDPCYLYYISPLLQPTINANPITTDLGLHDAWNVRAPVFAEKIYITLTNNYLSSKIVDVLTYLNKKGMITMRYIYASPLTHSFRVTGTVYINQLASVDDLKKQANNSVYQFLDKKNDFNVSVNKSNIVEIIESFDGVDHVDIRFEPDIPLPVLRNIDPSYRSTFYFAVPGLYPPIDSHDDPAGTAATIYTTINYTLPDFFGTGYTEPLWRALIEDLRTKTPEEIYNGDPYWMNEITERYLLNNIAKEIYNRLVTSLGASTPTVTKFQDSNDFITVISDIQKDLLWAIRCNMIDSNGNIAPEYEITENTLGPNTKTLLRGGFSLGNEIAKLNLDQISVDTLTPYLNYIYK